MPKRRQIIVALSNAAIKFLVVVFCFYISFAADAAITEAELRAGVSDHEEGINSISVRMTTEGIIRPIGRKDPEPAIQRSRVETITLESAGRARCEIEGKRHQRGQTERDEKYAGTFNGHESRFVRGRSGMITANRGDLAWALDPLEFLTHYGGSPISRILQEKGARIMGKVTHEEHELLVVETTPVSKEQNWKSMFWIDPSRGFIVVKRARLVQFPPHERWIEYTRTVGSDYNEVETGIWLPSRVLYESFNPTEEHAQAGTEPPMAWRWDIKNANWIVNPVVDDALFTLEFPPNVLVEDQVLGRVYRVTAITDDMVDGLAQRALEWIGIGSPRWRWMLILFNVMTIAFIVWLLIWRKQHA